MIDFGREICGDLASAAKREWLVTNGIGGYASGTVAGLLSRRYHGVGSISEIFDGDPPFTPRGCIAQAWGVAELLRAWQETGDVRQAEEA